MIGGGRRAHDPRKFGLRAREFAPDCFLSPASASLSCSSFLFRSEDRDLVAHQGKAFPSRMLFVYNHYYYYYYHYYYYYYYYYYCYYYYYYYYYLLYYISYYFF